MAAADYNDVVQQLYVAYFGRPADPQGLASFSNALNAAGAPTTITALNLAYGTNATVKSIVDSFGTSTESNSLYGSGSTVQFVNAIYNNVLGRDAELEGLLYWANLIDSGVLTRAHTALAIMEGAVSNVAAVEDAATVANKVAVANNFTDAIDTASELIAYSGDTAAATARSMLDQVDNETDATVFQSTVTSTLESITTGSTALAGTTFTLTTGVDIVTGTTADDTVLAYVASTGASDASATTLSVADQIDGGAGTDTLSVTLTNTAASIAPVLSGIEVVTLRAVSTETANFSLVNAGTGITAVNVAGTSDISIAGLTNGSKVVFSGGWTKTAVLASGTGTDTTADTITLGINDVTSADIAADAWETVNLVVNNTAGFINGEAFSLSAATALNVSGTANVVLNFGSGIGNGRGAFTGAGVATGSAIGDLVAINATALNGNLTLVAGTAGVSQTILGGAGNDTFYLSANFNVDTLDAGAGSDTVIWTNTVSGTFRPSIQGVETLTMDFGADAVINLSAASAASISTLNVLGVATTSIFCALSSATKTINVQSGAATGGIIFNYVTGAASDVVLNLTNEATATSTASYNAGDLTLANNTGSLTLNVVGSASGGQAIDALAASAVNSLTINVTSGQFAASAFAANAATAVTINVNNGKTATIDNASFTSVGTVAVNLSGATANANLGDVNFGAAGNLTVTLGAGTTGFTMGTAKFGNTASTAATTNSITITNNGSGTVTLSGLDLTTAAATAASASQVTFDLTVNQTGSGAVFNSTAMQFGSIDTAAVNITLGGQGTFNLAATATMSALTTGQVTLSTTAVSTGFVSANFTAFADTNVTFNVNLGTHSAVIALGAGVDTVQFGANSEQTVYGGLGNDQLTMGNASVSFAAYDFTAGTAGYLGTDSIFNAGSGDVILINGIQTSTGSALGTATMATGTAWVYGTAAAVTASVSTATLVGHTFTAGDVHQWLAMYTAGGAMVIEISARSASAAANSADSVATIRLEGKGDITAATALLMIDANGSGQWLLTLR